MTDAATGTVAGTVGDQAVAPSRRDLAIHLVTVVVAGLVLLWIDRHQWFIADEWNMLVDRRIGGGGGSLGIWDAHNSHLAATVTIAYRGLFALFGTRTYLPYLTLMILCQLAVMHLLWRLMIRLGIAASLATVAALLFAVLGQGFEITTGAFGMQNAGALAFGLGALLVMPASGPFTRRDALTWALTIAAVLTSSGVAIPLVAVVTLVALVRRGWRVAVWVAAAPAIVFLAWYARYGETGSQAEGALGTGEALRGMPTFVAHGVWLALQHLLDLGGGGPFVLLAFAVVIAFTVAWREASWQIALCVAAGAPLYLAFTTVGRGGFGVEVAGASRYSYVVVALLLPLIVLTVDRLARRHRRSLVLAVAAVGALVALQVVVLDRHARDAAAAEQEVKRRMIAAAEILRSDAPTLGVAVPDYMPNVTNAKLLALDRDGELPGNVVPSARDRLTAALYLQVAVLDRPVDPSARTATSVAGPAPDPATGCATIDERTGPVKLRLARAGAVGVSGRRDELLELRLVTPDGAVTSRPRLPRLGSSGEGRIVDLAIDADLMVDAPVGPLEVCAVTGRTD